MHNDRIEVRPIAGGWRLDFPASRHPLMFASGGRAEANAHQLARCLASLGRDVDVVLHDRGERVVGMIHYRAGLS
jgi:hypothetical protein